jgi:very-short-patch-repair endonuclease
MSDMDNTLPSLSIALIFDRVINYAFQQNAIPVVKELLICNNATPRKDLTIRVTTEPAFATPMEFRLQGLAAQGEHRVAPLDLKLSPDFLAGLNERISGLLRVEVLDGGGEGAAPSVVQSTTENISLLAHNEWCGLVSLPEILAAFVLPNDPAVMPLLDRASEILGAHTGRTALNGYQDKSRRRAWEQVAAIYKAVAELGLRYISPPASFENTGQKIRFPSDIVRQRFGTCLELALLFAACCEQAGLHPLILMHEGHAYAGCWLEERTLPEPSIDDLQQIRKLSIDALITVFETTIVAGENPGTLSDAERLARSHLETGLPFRLALDVRRARIARIHPLPIPGRTAGTAAASGAKRSVTYDPGLGNRDFVEWVDPAPKAATEPLTRIDQWKSRLLDLSLRNRLLNFRPTKLTIPILSASPEHVEDELAAEAELSLQPKPKLMGADDPRHADTYTRQQRADALEEHLRDELTHGRLHSGLDEFEHGPRLTQLFRAARLALEENGTNTLFAAVGVLEWRETEHSDRVLRAPLLLVPVELKRKSVLEGFTVRRVDEETRLNVTLMEMLRQQFQKEIPGLDPLPEDANGVNVARVFQLFREAVRGLPGWEVKAEIWLGQFSFTKFLLWKDLTDRLDDLTRNRIVHHLVNEAGHQYPNPPGDIQPEQLDDQFHPREIFCPRSADSSQLAAVLAAAAGYDFVLEGPPGTGKSQTITNIIAHCLASGKRVLFVAEKRAALDVVYRRLREDGLEPFCLELHSNKAGKADVVAQFDRSLKFITGANAHDWEHQAAELERLRSALNGYTRALHFRHPCGLSAYHCLDYLLPRQSELTVRLDDWSALHQTTTETLERARELARLLQERSRQLQPLVDHPLAPLYCEDWSPAWAERALDHVHELDVLTASAAEAARDLRKWMGCSTTSVSRAELIHLHSLAETLLTPQPVGPAFATTPWNQLVAGLNEWIALTQERADLRANLVSLLEERPQQPGATAGHPLHQLACEEWSSLVAERIFGSSRELCELINGAGEAARDLHTLLRFPRATVSRTELVHLVGLVDSLLGPLPVGTAFATAPRNEIVAALDGWIALVRERAGLRAKLKEYDEAKLLALDLDALQQRWESAQTAWFLAKWLRIGGVRRQLRTARPDNARPDVASLAAILKAALRLRTINASLASATPDAEAYLGLIWARGEPDGEALAIVRAWGEALHASMAACAGNDLDWLGQLRQLLAGLFNAGPTAYAPGTPVGDRLSRYRDMISRFDEAFTALSAEICLKRGPLDDAPDHLSAVAGVLISFLQNATRLRAINSSLTSAAPTAQACLGVIWNKGEPSVKTLAETHAWGKALHSSMVACVGGNLPWLSQLRHLLAGLFAEGPTAYAPGTSIGDRLGRYRDAFAQFDEAFDWFVREVHLQRSAYDAATDYFAAVRALTERLPVAWPKLRLWCAWQKARQEGLRLNLSPIITQLESPDGPTVEAPGLFERSFRRALLFAIIELESVLREFFGHEHTERIERFRHLDKMMATLTRDLIRARLAASIPRDQVQHDIPKAELGLLRREIGKKTRHIPVRQLLSRIPKLLPRLKPCVLMSPLSVAQYLEPSHEPFDVVIFDEASQIPVWDAVGAIARGTQLIVVGDPKQLPPTNFFNITDDPDAEGDDSELQQDLESILDELLSNGLRHKRLQWHYRSRHESLIAFSNRQYYENDLLTFPSPETAHGGIRFKHLPDARYDKGKSRTNLVEARALVEELVRRLRQTDGPPRSYGVVTFSQAQQHLIENLLDEERRKCPEIEVHFNDEPPVDGEPVFVKNLENVQGDERDVIVFSICYGPDEAGRVSMNFGPLNRDGGERRLNVAITRAKHEVLVFSSLRGEQIDLTRTRARGVRDLKYFLDYAERGPKALAAATTASADTEADSEFERMVADRIRAAGYEIHHQVGCSGYRIDLGVIDPRCPGRYLLGVECDGATYHRAATARDRDKLRQMILEGLGWKLYRIWSTDWWHDAGAETGKLLSHLNDLLQQLPLS